MAGNPDLIARAAAAAGFRGDALLTAVAVAGAESGFGADKGPSRTNDYGDWQINLPSHPQYNATQLLSSDLYNAQAAYAISGGGRNWSPWTTYTSGAYRQFLGQAQQAVAKLGAAAASAARAAADFVFPLAPGSYTQTQGYGGAGGHPGVDLGAPQGSPIYAAATGVIASVGGDPTGFGNDYPVEVLPDGTRLTYGHAERSLVRPGQTVVAGQEIALVGTEGDSNGYHLHFQVNLPNGQTTDPLAWLAGHHASAGGQAVNATLAAFPGGNWDPLNWPGAIAGAAGDAASSAIGDALRSFAGALAFLTIKGLFVLVGGALVVLGVASTAQKSTALPSMPSSVPIPIPA